MKHILSLLAMLFFVGCATSNVETICKNKSSI